MENQQLLSNIIKFKPNGDLFLAKGKNVLNVETYSVGNYSDVETLKILKLQFSETSENAKFIKTNIIPKLSSKFNNIDVIVYPYSSSKLLKFFSEELAKQTNCKTIPDAFIKSLPSEISIDTNGVVLELKTLKSLYKIIETAETNGYFELKKVPLQFRNFFTGYIKLSKDSNSFIDKNVLVVDDVLSSGSTISEIYKILYANGAKSITGVTLLKKR
jgi:predicted amidophosphoribosyltransferase